MLSTITRTVWVGLNTVAVSFLWLVLVSIVIVAVPNHQAAAFSAAVVLVLLCICAIRLPRLRQCLPVWGDLIRGRVRRIHRQQRISGYCAARDLGIITRVDDEEAALRRPRLLPVADFIKAESSTRLEVEQQSAAATDVAILGRAAAFAPTISMPSEFISLSRSTPGSVTVEWRTSAPEDPLREPVLFRPIPTSNPSAPVCIGITNDGDSFHLHVFTRMTLLLGATGSGKSSVLHSVLGQLAPHIHAGLISAHAIDLKGGIEAESARELFSEVAYDYEAAEALIDGLAERMSARLKYMRTNGLRKHTPTLAEPLELLVIDEAAALTYCAPDRKSAERLNANLKLVLTQGRAAGFAIIAALQDPRKESLPTRDVYSQTVALRFRTRDDAVLALGTSAYEAGAHAERIPQGQPGTGYVIDGDTGDVIHFRAFLVEDEVIRHIAQTYAAPTESKATL